ncbi:diguanylate cyclase [Pelomonas sp. KK5]|uniref:diguanylate cyclase n=1 Tax=Pelomonas sp. KK5 TaxID=1855730 RepID=UPI00097CA407|nr:diguanylate cyclase [Pelomonas sp. KK5]
MKVFLVEGCATSRRRLVRQLRGRPGLRLVGEAGGETEAMALIGWTAPDLILLALPLIEGSGLHLIEALRRGGFAGRIVVLLDAKAQPQVSRVDCLAAGADAFMDKAGEIDIARLFDVAAPARGHATEPTALLRDGLAALHNQSGLCRRLAQCASSELRPDIKLAVFVLRLVSTRSLPAVHAELMAHMLVERLRQAGGQEADLADVVVRRSGSQFSLVMPVFDASMAAAERARQIAAAMGEPLSTDDRGSALKVELGLALFAIDQVPTREPVQLAQARAFAAM